MKYFKILFYLLPLMYLMTSCDQADDICTEGGTPKMKVRFKKESKQYTVPKLFVDILDGSDTLRINKRDTVAVDSILIPLKVDGQGRTEILIRTAEDAVPSKLLVKYTETSEYVSPGCGIRKLYDDLQTELSSGGPIKEVEINENRVHDEIKTILYFDF